MKQESPLLSTVSNLAGAWARLLIGMVSGIVLARALGPELRGQYANLKLILTLYVPILLFGYAGGTLYYGLRGILDIRKFYWSGFTVTLLIGVVFAPLLLTATQQGWLGAVSASAPPAAVMLMMLCVPLVMCNLYSEKSLLVFHQFRAVNAITVAGASVTVLYYTGVVLFGQLNLVDGMIGLVAGEALKFLLLICFLLKTVRIEWGVSHSDVARPWQYGARAMGTFVINRSSDKFDQIVLAFLLTPAAYGVYAVAVTVSNLVAQLPSSYLSVFYNQIAGGSHDESLDLYCKSQRITFVVTGAIATMLVISAGPLVFILYGEQFSAGAQVIMFYAPGVVFQVAARLSNKFYAARGRPLKNTVMYLCGFIVSVPFYYVLIPGMGLSGAAVASSIGYFAAFIASFLQLRREYGISFFDVFGFRRDDWALVVDRLRSLPFVPRILHSKFGSPD